MSKLKYLLILGLLGAVTSFIFSWLSIGKLNTIGVNNYENLLLSLRIINRDVLILSFSLIVIVAYIYKKDN